MIGTYHFRTCLIQIKLIVNTAVIVCFFVDVFIFNAYLQYTQQHGC